ncbi:MAG: carbohydrate ABC transporter permease [Caldilineaceae bacterium]
MQAAQPLSQPTRTWLPRTFLGQLFAHAVLLFVSLLTIFPFVWMIFASFKTFKDLVSSQQILPEVWTLNNYIEIASRVNFPIAFFNSIVAATVVTLFTLLTSAALGYIFAKYRFWGKEKLFLLLLSTMMVPFAVVLVPLYLTITSFGLANSLGGIIITGLWSSFGMFMLRQFMESIPLN